MITRAGFCLVLLGILWGASAYAHPFVIDSTGTENKNGKTYVLHRVEAGQTLYAVMRKYKTTIKALKDANPGMKDNLAVGQIVRVPSENHAAPAKVSGKEPPAQTSGNGKLVVDYEIQSKNTPPGKTGEEKPKAEIVKVEEPKEAPSEEPAKDAENEADKSETKPAAVPVKVGIHRVEGGQSLYGIAVKHGVLMAEIRRWNGLTSDQLRSGQELIVSESVYRDYLKKNKSDSAKPAETVKANAEKMPPLPHPEDLTNANLPEPKIANTGKRILETGVAEVLDGIESNNKYLALHRTAPVGSLIQVKNVNNSQSVWVKVIGKLPDVSANNRIIIKLSARAQEKLSPGGRQFIAEISYLSQ
ncbi:MAG: LysM peptidoglycan-binding domain-containing protein [Spirosomataceae bacterium]